MDAVDKINFRLKKLKEYVGDLKEHQGVTAGGLKKDKAKRKAIERDLQLAAEVVIDVANLLNAEYRFRPAEDSRDSILILGEEGVLEEEFSQRLALLAGFRNILVHDYLKIDYEIVAEKVNKQLDDFDRFAVAVARFLT